MPGSDGYNVLWATNAEEVLLIGQQYKGTIHLMITDAILPGIHGPELVKYLVALKPEMKLLYMSGHTKIAAFHHGVLEEGVNYIQKPFSIKELPKMIREVLDM